MRGDDLTKAAGAEPRLPLWLTYMRQRRKENGRLGLVLGAGVSRDAGCPMWPELITRLTNSMKVPLPRIEKHRKAGHTETFIAEVIFRNYIAKQAKRNRDVPAKFRQFIVDASWREEIHKCLYQGIVKKSFLQIAKKHSYLTALAELVCKSGFAVTFNFDDIVDEAVIAHAGEHNLPNPEIITRPKIETRKEAPVIYHINGFLPREELRRASEKIVLTENAFADILLSPNSHDAEFVINQFATKTFLLLGISLSDNSLKNLLRSSANRNPANHHFVVYHEKDHDPLSAEARNDIFDVNLHVYNLISIFLTTEEIKTFIEVLNLEDGDEFEGAMSGLLSNKIDRKYYLVGSVASGKSSALEALRCFQTHEEWSGRVPAAMYLDDKSLTPNQQKEVDNFLFPQLISKNNKMVSKLPGIRIMDRAYLDLFAFSKDSGEVERKGLELRRRFQEMGKRFEDGHIFFLKASKDILDERMARRGSAKNRGKKRKFGADALIAQEAELLQVYKPDAHSVFDTTYASPGEIAKHMARAILLEPYTEFSFEQRLDEILNKGGVL